jgi:hypothetical protein
MTVYCEGQDRNDGRGSHGYILIMGDLPDPSPLVWPRWSLRILLPAHPPTSKTTCPRFPGPSNIAKYDLTFSLRRTPLHSGPVPVFSGFIPSGNREMRETRYRWLRCTRIPAGVFRMAIPAGPAVSDPIMGKECPSQMMIKRTAQVRS